MNDQVLSLTESTSTTAPIQGARSIVVASTYTADLVRRPLEFWMEALDIPARVDVAPYGQLMQELLDPSSLFSRDVTGVNAILLRLQDWLRDRSQQGIESNVRHLRDAANELVTALMRFRARSSATVLIVFCPASSQLPPAYAPTLADIEDELAGRLQSIADVRTWKHADLMRMYPVSSYEDEVAERLGHIPYSNEYFIAVGTLLSRHIGASIKSKHKVIAVDCDNTLWKGVCGEDGPDGIELTPAHLELQRLLVRQHDAGMLICLCTKNNPADVEAVFKQRADMVLREEHLVSSRANWHAKSANLKSLADELSLALDSFVFIDDSALECAEVSANCAGVLTISLPQSSADMLHVLEHAWAFDRIVITEDGKRRTAQYKQNRAREQALHDAGDLHRFLESLQLEVKVAPMRPDQLPRVAELVQRTTQFNLTAARLGASELDARVRAGGLQVLAVEVRDRFGDYGLVGAVCFRWESSALEVETFVLSCRVLGRGVEHEIVSELARVARRSERSQIVLKYRQTARNVPARTFIDRHFAQFQVKTESLGRTSERLFVVPVSHAEELRNAPIAAEQTDVSEAVPAQTVATGPHSLQWHETALHLSRLPDIARAIDAAEPRKERGVSNYVSPQTPTEAAVAEIWCQVLRIDAVSTRDEFFELGGDSLQAVQVVARVASVLGRELSLLEFFDLPTVQGIAARLADARADHQAIPRKNATRGVPLSSAQQRLWFIEQLEGRTAAYHVPVSLRLRGELNELALQQALDALIERHESLRTGFVNVNGEPMQEIMPSRRFALKRVNVGNEDEVSREYEEELHTLFDLRTGPLIRGRLLRFSSDESVLLITMHHIVSDGWSIGILIKELGELYAARCEGRADQLAQLPIQYADYAHWQRQWQQGAQLRAQLEYWKEYLQGAPQLLELPTDRPRPAIQSYRGGTVRVALGAELTRQLKAFSQRMNLTPAMTLYATWSIVLSRLSGQQDIVVGMPVANRRRTELEGLIGFFVNTLALRVRMEDDPSVQDLLRRVKEMMLSAYAHQDTPFEQVVEVLQPTRSLSHSPVFQAMFVMHTTPRSVVRLRGVMLTEEDTPIHTSHFDIALSLQETGEAIRGTLNYASDLFDASTVERWSECFIVALRALLSDPHLQVSRVPLMSAAARRQILEGFNTTQMEYPREKLIHQLFEEQAIRTPEAVAVICDTHRLTYAQLNQKANRLAMFLRDRGVSPDRFVGIFMERGIDMLVAMFGILKAGGAYVPLDPNYPQERLQYMLQDTQPTLVLTQRALLDQTPAHARAIAIDGDWQTIEETAANAGELHETTAAHLAYMIFTSGSTGRPKGVAIEHRNAVNLIWWAQTHIPRECFARTLQSTSINFDLSVYECFVPLSVGGSIEIVDNVMALARATSQATLINTVPSALAALLDSGSIPRTTRVVNLAGEALKQELVERIFQHDSVEQVCNLYGPSETTTYSTWVAMARRDGFTASIGRPLANNRIYILDRHRQPVPIGVAGEIYIAGAGVAREYLNRPELTAERFVADHLSADIGRMYRTGDLGRWRADGTIEYSGRNDHQVKLRGFRIELGEIEAQLAQQARVKQAVVIAREDDRGDRRLVAYIVPTADDPPAVDELRSRLRAALPDYMVPAIFVMLEALPMTPNGKLDRRALPAPEIGVGAAYEPPQGEIETLLAQLWQELLAIEQVGRDDNVFELGGHSLLAMQVLARVQSALPVQLPVRLLFEFPTIRMFGAQLEKRLGSPLHEAFVDDSELDELLASVGSISESKVEQLLRGLEVGGRL